MASPNADPVRLCLGWLAEERAVALVDTADLAEEHAWASALKCPPEESSPTERLIAGAQVKVLTDLAGGLRVLAAMALEGR